MSVLRRSVLAVTFVSLTIVAQCASAAELLALTVERGVTVKMRDGTALRADIYRPKT